MEPPTGAPNPYEFRENPNKVVETAEGAETAEVVTAEIQPPRIWTALLSFPLAFGMYSFVQAIPMGVIAVILIAIRSDGENGPGLTGAQSFTDVLTDPLVLLPGLLTGQLALVAMVIGAAILSPYTVGRRLNLKPIGLPIWVILCTAIGTLFVASCAMMLFALIGFTPSEHLQQLSAAMTGLSLPMFAASVMIIGILPGFGEEFLFRGYIQTRLLERWPPLLAIFGTSAMFAVMHVDPQHMLFAFPLGLWCGVVAWRTGSLWTAVLCHSTNNTVASFMQQFSDSEAGVFEITPISLVLAAISLPCFLVSIYFLFKRISPESHIGNASITGDDQFPATA